MKTDIEIAQSADIWPIEKIVDQIGLSAISGSHMVVMRQKFG